ncbi:Ig-like domain-containing protein [Reichenbachiella sp.]|uniref:Ig-like domain-containing protein n=1 Tax=Reichenbachiella sp. TaxID=2184521 RepID=UPI003B5A9117
MKKITLLIGLWIGLSNAGRTQTYDNHTNFIDNNGKTVYLEDMVFDDDGNIYISGSLTATASAYKDVDFDPGVGTANITSPSFVNESTDMLFLAKYNAAGEYQWVRWMYEQLDQAGLYGGKLAISTNGNVYMTANVKNSAKLSSGEDILGPYVFGVPVNGYSGKVIGYTSAGVLDRIIETPFEEDGSVYMEIKDLVADPILGHVFIGGIYSGSPNSLPSTAEESAYLSYVSTVNGSFFNTKTITEGGNNASINALAWISDGSLAVVGGVGGTPDFDPSGSTHTGSAGGFVANYTSGLNFVWANTGITGSSYTAIKESPSGNPSTVFYNSSSKISLLHEFNIDNGTQLSANQLSDEQFSAQDFAFAANGDVYVVGTILQGGSAESRGIVKTLSNGDQAYTTPINSNLNSHFGRLEYDNDIVTLYGNTSSFDADLSAQTVLLTDGINKVAYDVSESDTPPTILSYTPEHGATHGSGNLTYTVEFDQNITYVGEDGSIYLRQKGTSSDYDVKAADVSTSGTTATIEINTALRDGSTFLQYELFITDTAFESEDQLAFDGNIITRPTVNVNYQNPTISSLSPLDGASEVALNANLVITFNENIRAGQYAGDALYDIRVRSSLTNEQEFFFLSDPEVTVGTNSITIDPSSNFDSNDELYVNIYYGVVELDVATDGLYLNPITSGSQWNFTTEAGDLEDPYINGGQYPSVGSSCIGTASFNVTFNEPIQYGTGEVELYKSDGTKVSTLDMESDVGRLDRQLSNYRFHFSFDYTLDYGQEYYIQICNTCVEDIAGNTFDGVLDDSWNFTSRTKPTITTTSPEHNDTNVGLETDVVFTMSEPVQVNSGSKSAILKYVNGDGEVTSVPASSFVFNMDGTVTIPLPTLSENTAYYLELEADALSSNCGTKVDPITGSSTLSFTTLSNNEPPTDLTLSSNTIEENNETGDVIGTFSTADADQISGFNYTFAAGGVDNGSFSITGLGELRASGVFDYEQKNTYNIRVKTTDSKGASFEKDFEIQVLDLDEIAPTISMLTPTNGATSVAIDADLVLTFSEEVQDEGGYIRVKRADGSQVNVSGRIASHTDQFTLTQNQLIIHLANANLQPLSHGVQYYVQIDDWAIEDLNGNNFAGIADNASTWSFTIEKATQSIDITAVSDKLTSDGLFDIQATTTSNLALSYNVVSGPATNSGKTITLNGTTGTVVVEVSQAGNDFYHPDSETVSFQVNDPSKSEQTITFSIDDQVYGNTIDLTASTTSGLPVSYELLSGPATRSDNQLLLTGVGIVAVRATAEGDDTYNPAVPIELTFDVEKAQLTVTAQDQSIVYGEALPVLTMAYNGFVNGEDAGVLSEVPTLNTTATADSDAGIYDIELSGGAADNYALTLVDGMLTIAKATATVTFSDLTHDEDGTAKSPSIVTDPADLTIIVTYDGVADAPSAAGTYEVVATIDDVNYSGTATATLAINDVTVTDVAPASVELAFYPNPTSEWLSVSGLKGQTALLTLMDMDGRLVMQTTLLPKSRLDVSNLKKGIYMLRLDQNDITTTTKILIH